METTFYVFYRGQWVDTLGPHYGLTNETEAAERYRALHPEMKADETKISRHPPQRRQPDHQYERGAYDVCRRCGGQPH